MISRDQWLACVEVTDRELRWLWYIPKSKDEESFASMVKFEVIPLPPEVGRTNLWHEEELKAFVAEYLKKRKAELGVRHSIKLRVGLPIQNQFIREYRLPWVPKGERGGLIKYLAEEEIPIPRNELIYDCFIREEKGSQKELLAVLSAIRRSAFGPVVTSLRDAGFEIERVTFAQLALVKALNFTHNENTLFLREEEGQVQFVFYRGLIPEITRNFPPAAQYYNDEEWDLEIHRMLLYFSSLNEQVELHRLVVGQGKEAEKVGQRISDYNWRLREKRPLLQKCEEIHSNLLSPEKLKNLSGSEPERMLAVLGMALEEGKDSLNNFWRVNYQKKRQERTKQRAVGLVLVLNVLGFALLLSSQQSLELISNEVNQLREYQAVLAAAEQEERDLELAWEEVKRNSTTVGDQLRELSAFNSDTIQFDHVEIKGSELVIQGVATESLEVQGVFQQLEAAGWRNVFLANYQLNYDLGRSSISFTLKAEVNKNRGLKT